MSTIQGLLYNFTDNRLLHKYQKTILCQFIQFRTIVYILRIVSESLFSSHSYKNPRNILKMFGSNDLFFLLSLLVTLNCIHASKKYKEGEKKIISSLDCNDL